MNREVNKSMVKRAAGLCLLTGLLLGLSRPGLAGQGPVEVLQSMTETLLEIVRQDPDVIHDTARLRDIATEVVLPRVDFNALSRWVLGKHWRTATAQQRSDFIIEFREMLLGNYLRSVSEYRDNTIRFMPLRGEQQAESVTVNAEVEQPDGPVVHVSFRMHNVANEWLIYDVSVEGISLVTTHRSSFSQQIHNSGMDGLIESLRSLNANRAAENETGTTAELASK
jgi:phospholipid transport system substrate-binding protein